MAKISDLYERYVACDFSTIDLESVIQAVSDESSEVKFQLHPLGFVHGELGRSLALPAGERFRLHIWLNHGGSLDQLGDLHEHTWDLTSLVLAGEVVDQNYDAIASSDGPYSGTRIVYGDRNQASSAGRYDLRLLRERTVTVGESYTIPSRTIHLNQVSEIPTVTLVRSVTDRWGHGPLVLTPLTAKSGAVTGVREEVNAADVLRCLREAIAKKG